LTYVIINIIDDVTIITIGPTYTKTETHIKLIKNISARVDHRNESLEQTMIDYTRAVQKVSGLLLLKHNKKHFCICIRV
jgi:hypothetical protein